MAKNKKFSYLLKEKMEINKRQIFCKVTGAPGSAADGRPYVLVITGGPGFGHALTEAYMKRLFKVSHKQNIDLPHFIFFDNLGCGKSDKAQDQTQEYTVDNFTEIAAAVAEAVKQKLNLNQMNLFVEGGSFGSLVAMNVPLHRPQWLKAGSDINLKQIVSTVGPNGSGEAPYTFKFLAENYADHPNYTNIVKAQEKLFAGDFKDQKDYVLNFFLHVATIYAKDQDTRSNRWLKKIVETFPTLVVRLMTALNRLLKLIHMQNDEIELRATVLGGCSLEVINHFFKNDFDGFNLIERIRNNKDLYQQIPICLISANKDHMVDYKIAQTINQLLPDSSAAIIFKDAHMVSKGPKRDLNTQIIFDLLVSANLDLATLDKEFIAEHTVSNKFLDKLLVAHQNTNANVTNLNKSSSTAKTYHSLQLLTEENLQEQPQNDNKISTNNFNPEVSQVNENLAALTQFPPFAEQHNVAGEPEFRPSLRI